jgi:hypothetical protein
MVDEGQIGIQNKEHGRYAIARVESLAERLAAWGISPDGRCP